MQQKKPESIKNFRRYYKAELKKKDIEIEELKHKIKILTEEIKHLKNPKKRDIIKKEDPRDEIMKKYWPEKFKDE